MSEAAQHAPEDEAASRGLVTKADLWEVKDDLKGGLKELKDSLKELKDDLKGALASKEDFAKLKGALKNDLASKEDLKEFKGSIFKVSTIIISAVAALGICFGAIITAIGLTR